MFLHLFRFLLDELGSVDTSKKREAEIVKQKLQSQAVSFCLIHVHVYTVVRACLQGLYHEYTK